MKMKGLGHEELLKLNQSSIRAGRGQNLRPEHLSGQRQDCYWVNMHTARERDGQHEVRMCVVLRLYGGQTAWLDVSAEEFAAILESDISYQEWEAAMCAGNPPPLNDRG